MYSSKHRIVSLMNCLSLTQSRSLAECHCWCNSIWSVRQTCARASHTSTGRPLLLLDFELFQSPSVYAHNRHSSPCTSSVFVLCCSRKKAHKEPCRSQIGLNESRWRSGEEKEEYFGRNILSPDWFAALDDFVMITSVAISTLWTSLDTFTMENRSKPGGWCRRWADRSKWIRNQQSPPLLFVLINTLAKSGCSWIDFDRSAGAQNRHHPVRLVTKFVHKSFLVAFLRCYS